MRAEQREGRPGDGTGSGLNISTAIKNDSSIAATADHLTYMQRQVVLDAVLDAWGATWERRARALEVARPRPGDFHGRAGRDDLRRRWETLTEAARACRARAKVSPIEELRHDLANVLSEAS